jgi:NADH-quinone oxidoreductase subunit N
MNIALRSIDFAAISPLIILLVASLVLLLLETFTEKGAKKGSAWVALAALVLALIAALFAPNSENSLLTPWLRFDPLARFFTVFFLAIGLATTLLAASFFERFDATRGEFYFLLLSALFGLILIGASADFLTLFLGLETLSIALYILCGYIKKWEISYEAAIKYFLIGSFAAAFLLYGIALIYGAIGTTHFDGLLDHYRSLSVTSDKILFLGGIALVTLGFAFKAAIVPFHVWAPDVYDGAPTPVTAFMAVGTKVGAFAAFARVFLVALPQFDPIWNQGVAWLAILTLIYANLVALRQVQLRRFFAYSGISHAGFSLLPIVAGTEEALAALCFYLVIYALATLGSFAILAFLDTNSQGVFLRDLHGLFHRAPFLAGIFALCLLTLAGIPPTAGFFAKFYVFKVAFQAGYYSLVIVGLLTTIISAFYYLRIVSIMFTEAPAEASAPPYSWPAALVGVASFVALIIFSCYPEPLMALMSFANK